MRTVMVFGDSNSYGTPGMPDLDFWGRFAPEERWPGVMLAALGRDWRLVEESLPGRTTVHDDPIEGAHKNGLKALPVALESHRPIDLVVVKLGTNDLKARFAVTPEDIALSLGKLVRVILASEAGPDGRPPRVLVVSPAPILETGVLAAIFAGGAAKSRRLAPAIEAETRRQGAAFLDAAPLIEVDPLDGIHLKAQAHAGLGRAVAESVRALFATA